MKQTSIALAASAAVLMMADAAFAQAKDDKGMQVFRAQKCTQCHAIAGIGNKKGALDEIGSKLTPVEIRAWITDPDGMRAKTQPPPTRKPVMKKLSMPAGDLDALVAMLKDLKKP
jgi:mono/diheme cytochrome c family protein